MLSGTGVSLLAEFLMDPAVAGILAGLAELVRAASGWPGLVIIFVYSFLIAFILPLPSEIVLVAPLRLGVPYEVQLVIIMLVSGLGKAAGSVLAFRIGHTASRSGPVIRAVERTGFDVMAWSERRLVHAVQKYGYVGLAMALTVPGFPDTLSIYAFSVLEKDYLKFAAATFAGSVGRLLFTVGVVGGTLAFV